MSTSNVFPLPKSHPTTAPKAGPKKRRATRANIVPATPFITGGKLVHGGAKGPVEAWPETPSDVIYYPNALARSSVFGGTRTARAKTVESKKDSTNKKKVGDLYEFRSASSTSQYEIGYRGEILNQQDAEVWIMALATARRAGLAGEEVEFTLNDWCRALGRPENDWFANQAILASLERLKSATLKVFNRTTRRRDWFSMIVHMAEQCGRYTFTIDPRVAAMCGDDCTQIDVVRKSALTSAIAKWMHDFFSTTSNTFTWKLSMLRELSGCTHMEPGKFRKAVCEAVEELKNIKGKDGTEFAPVFAPEAQVETQIIDGKPCEVLVMVKGSNSLVLEPRKGAEMLAMLTATTMLKTSEPVAPKVEEVQPVPAATVTALPVARRQAEAVKEVIPATRQTHSQRNEQKNPPRNQYDEIDLRSPAEKAAARQRSRVAL
ncbi:TPA: hypothetical protein QDB01_000377 [Burkholderia vietnamiensis]|nr:hypothetical protein [Burkholderia vietnamiensis]